MLLFSESTDIERAKRLLSNEDFIWAKSKLDAILAVYESIGTLDYKLSDTALAKELRRRRGVTGLINSWFDEIEGTGTMDIPQTPDTDLVHRF